MAKRDCHSGKKKSATDRRQVGNFVCCVLALSSSNLRLAEGSGRPLGTADFVTSLERLLGRPIARRAPGRKDGQCHQRTTKIAAIGIMSTHFKIGIGLSWFAVKFRQSGGSRSSERKSGGDQWLRLVHDWMSLMKTPWMKWSLIVFGTVLLNALRCQRNQTRLHDHLVMRQKANALNNRGCSDDSVLRIVWV